MYSFLLIKNNGGYHFLLYSGSISYSGHNKASSAFCHGIAFHVDMDIVFIGLDVWVWNCLRSAVVSFWQEVSVNRLERASGLNELTTVFPIFVSLLFLDSFCFVSWVLRDRICLMVKKAWYCHTKTREGTLKRTVIWIQKMFNRKSWSPPKSWRPWVSAAPPLRR